MGQASLGHWVIGMEGLALLRHWLTGAGENVGDRLQEITRFINAHSVKEIAGEAFQAVLNGIPSVLIWELSKE